jgi:uncharacterized protein (DUF488 family)
VDAVIDPTAPPPVYTVGHSNHAAEAFLELLRRHEIATVVDVRSAPYSRFAPHFNRRDLEYLLGEAAIGYVFAGDALGGRPNDPTCYKNGVVPDGHANYLDLVDYPAVAERPWYREGIARLRETAAGRRVALLCSEEDPARCHRHHLIAQTLLAEGIPVRHIRATGEVEDALRAEPPSRQLSLL